MKRNVYILTSTISALLLGGAVLFSFQNCDSVKLSLVQKVVKAQAPGKICAQPPTNLQELHRFIFFTDNSGSMMGLDPGRPNASKRVTALRNFIDQFQSDDNFTIALGSLYDRYSGYLPDQTKPQLPNLPTGQPNCTFLKPRIPADYADLQTALGQLDTEAGLAFGNTPYLSVLDRMQSCVETDLSTTQGALYSLVFVTDGAPTDAAVQEVITHVSKLISLGKAPGDKFSRVNFYFLYLDSFNSSPEASNLVVQSIKAAQDAGGLRSKAILLDNSKPFDYSALGLFELPRYRLKQLMVTNLNAGVEEDGTLGPDSDGDGLTDKRELKLGYDPANYASKGVCSDMVFFKNGGKCPSSCPEGLRYIDSDHDGLTDCDESIIGTNPHDMDTDGDGIIDSVEYNLGLSPTDASDRDLDPDGDGVTNYQEAMRGTSPFIDDRKIPHKASLDVSTKESQLDDGTYCYEVNVTGVQVFPTLPVTKNTLDYMNHAKNENVIRFLFFEVPEDQPSAKPIVLESYRTIKFESSQAGLIKSLNELTTDDFNFITP